MSKRARGLHDDPLSAASAGLVALGIDRARRVDVLEVLGALLDHADPTGNVVLDQTLFAREEHLGVDKCLDAYALLEQLDVVNRTDRGWTINDFRWHAGPVGETEASLAVLRKHLSSIGSDASLDDLGPVPAELAPVSEPVLAEIMSAPVVPLGRIRRAVPIAAGVAASVAVVFGATQFVPQAAVTGRNAAQSSGAPTSVVRHATQSTASPITGAVNQPGSTIAPTTAPTLGPSTTATTPTGLNCVLPKVLTNVKSVSVVSVPLAGDAGATLWTAVINGTATLTDTDTSLVLPALEVVVHLADGDTDPVQATLTTPLLTPNKAAPFTAIVALGNVKPVSDITASATAAGLKSSC